MQDIILMDAAELVQSLEKEAGRPVSTTSLFNAVNFLSFQLVINPTLLVTL